MPFYLRISRCHKGHELTIQAEPINEDEIALTWGCEECARQTTEKPEASELRGDEAVGSGRNEPVNVVSPEALDGGIIPIRDWDRFVKTGSID